MKIAVMMAAHNRAGYVGDAIASLLRQRQDAELDIIVADDGSTDGTVDVVQKIGAEAPQVRFIGSERLGLVGTRNRLLDAVGDDADFVTILDSDDLLPVGRYARDLSEFKADPSLDMLYGDSLLFRTTGEDHLLPDMSAPTLRVRGIQMGAGLYRLELIRRVGRYDEAFTQAEDFDFLIRIFEQQPHYKLVPAICYYYRRHASNITRDAAAQIQRDFARALIGSVKRRARLGLGPLPAGIFDLKDFAGSGW